MSCSHGARWWSLAFLWQRSTCLADANPSKGPAAENSLCFSGITNEGPMNRLLENSGASVAVTEHVEIQAEGCLVSGGKYIYFYAGLQELIFSSPDASNDGINFFRNWLALLETTCEECVPQLEHFGVCLPVGCLESEYLEAAWFYFVNYAMKKGTVQFPEAVRGMPVPSAAYWTHPVSQETDSACEALRESTLVGFRYAPLAGLEFDVASKRLSRQASWVLGIPGQAMKGTCLVVRDVVFSLHVFGYQARSIEDTLQKHNLLTVAGVLAFLLAAVGGGWAPTALATLDHAARVMGGGDGDWMRPSKAAGSCKGCVQECLREIDLKSAPILSVIDASEECTLSRCGQLGLCPTHGGMRHAGVLPRLQPLFRWLRELDHVEWMTASSSDRLPEHLERGVDTRERTKPQVSHRLCEPARSERQEAVLHVVSGYIHQRPPPSKVDELVVFIFDEHAHVDDYARKYEEVRVSDPTHANAWIAPTSDESMLLGFFCKGESFSSKGIPVLQSRAGVHVRCPVPRWRKGSERLGVRSFTLQWSSPSEEGRDVPLRFCPAESNAAFVTLCTKPMWGGLEDSEDSLAHWVTHHARRGIDRFQLYDLDGVLEPQVEMLRRAGVAVAYFANFSQPYETLSQVRLQYGHNVLTEEVAWEHCRMSNYGLSEWVQHLHGVDSFLFSPRGWTLPEVLRLVDADLPDPLCTLSVVTARFGGQPLPSGAVADDADLPIIDKFIMREAEFTSSWHRDEPLYRPAFAWSVSNHRPLCDPLSRTALMPPELWRSNHYFDVVRARCVECTVMDTLLRDQVSAGLNIPASWTEA